MQKTLNIRFSTEEETTVVAKTLRLVLDTDDASSVNNMNNFISWVFQNNRGYFDENGDIICSSKVDYVGCQKQAMAFGLLPELSLKEIRARRLCVSSS